MRFGINILNFGPGTGPESLAGWARFAEEVGFHLIMISDHVAVTPDVQDGFPTPFYDPFVSLGWLAHVAKRVELGTTVTILPYRHPLLTARLAANIDNLSGGRFILGTGVGWARQEFAALGVPFERRGALADEYLEVIRLCWANEVASFEGQLVSFRDVYTGPRPLRPDGLPVWVGGSSDAAIKRAVRFGEAWHPYRFTYDWLKDEALPKLRRLADSEGRPAPAFCPRFSLRLTNNPLPEERRSLGHGSINQIHAGLKAMASLGAEYILLDTYTGVPGQTEQPEKDWEMLATLADQVLDLPNETIR
ncbi:MAG: TIGR03619 family F420-dependent LLM class oxidoreductase [Chloroflexota bacterium]|nr:MAG: TIGR03619 family F420-dependent LLM class oxidoreductase [Chloroflexota bacterium]